ncbi:hypothetical protein ACWEFL_05545 [Streptomyces sp. NPDC004838]
MPGHPDPVEQLSRQVQFGDAPGAVVIPGEPDRPLLGELRAQQVLWAGQVVVRAGAVGRVAGPQDGTVAEGMLVSPDGTEFIVSVHRPDAEQDPDYGYQAPDLRVVPATRGGTATDLTDKELDSHTVFLSWS